MLKNYFKVAWRSIVKNRFFSIINITGLSLGIAFTFIIGGYIYEELRVNADLQDLDRQYILTSEWKNPNMGSSYTTLAPLPVALASQYPHLVESFYRFDGITSNVSRGDNSFRETMQVGDSTLISMFGFTLLDGNTAMAMREPYSVLIGEQSAKKYFGRANVAGETLTIENFNGERRDFLITGVLKSPGRNTVTSFGKGNQFEFFIPENTIGFFNRQMNDWKQQHIVGFIKLRPGVSPGQLMAPAKQLLSAHAAPETAQNLTPVFSPLSDFYVKNNNGLVEKMIFTLVLVAGFILMMAIINYTNIAIGSSGSRVKEMGIRKVIGGNKKQLIIQFLTESILLVCLATFLSFLIYDISKDFFSSVLGKRIPSFSELPRFFLILPLLLVLVVGTLAGLYPAFVLSSLKTVDAVNGKMGNVNNKALLRRLLIGVQFLIAVVVFVTALTITRQVDYFLSKQLGYEKEYIISAQLPRDWTPNGIRKMDQVRNQFLALPEVQKASVSYEIPNGNNSGSTALKKPGEGALNAVSAQLLTSDSYFADTYQIPMKAGHFFHRENALPDTTIIVLNETAVKALGWDAESAIGKSVNLGIDDNLYLIGGVTRDFHFGSMQNLIPPIVFVHNQKSVMYRFLSLKLNPGNVSETLRTIEDKWREWMPGAPFEYRFMDDTLATLYQTETQLKKASFTASGMALFMMLLGVLGLVSMTIQKRMKEIGIRKILGASSFSIILLFIKDFFLVILIAGLLACMAAFFILQQWLHAYAYRIDLNIWPFLFAITVLIGLTVLLIAAQTYKATRINPIRYMRTD